MIFKEFKALGTDITIMADLAAGQENVLTAAWQEVLNFEKRFSRFIIDSELSRLNNSQDTEQKVSAVMSELLTSAKYYYYKTKGVYDPTILGSLEAVGYNQSFDKIVASPNEINLKELSEKFAARIKMDELEIVGGRIIAPLGFKIDLGGIGKGFIVDLLGEKFFSDVSNYWISAGGDILSAGDHKIDVQNPIKPEENIFYINTQGRKLGIATSGIIKRNGISGNFKWHHLIDPITGLPVMSGILSVTVISPTATKADILAKTVLIMGETAGLNFIEQEDDSACIIFFKDKEPIFSKRAKNFVKKYEDEK